MAIFISYSRSDVAFVDWLAGQLVTRRHHIWMDRWELSIGDSLISKIQSALTDSDAMLIVLSKNSVASEWCKKELNSGLMRELEEKRVLVLPCIIDDCTIPLFLREKLYADFRKDRDEAFEQVDDALFAIRLWHLTKRGTRVIIAHDDVQPVEITNPHLFKPKAVSGSPEFQAATVAGKSISTAAATHGSLVSKAEAPEATSLQVPSSAPAAAAPSKMVPISVFVSRKLGKLFVRQGFSPLFDVPVTIENPGEPLGTHVFTAMEFQNEGAAIRWTVVSIPEEFPRISEGATKEREAPVKQPALSVPSPDKANAVLNRIEIPQDTVERISELLTPASSLIISDNGLSHETGKDTDFIVVTH